MMPRLIDIALVRALPRRAPHGITLMEVIIATFVMSVGLLGLAALIPVARFQMIEAAKLDRGNTLARAAFDDLRVRGYLDPDQWLDAGVVPRPPLLDPANTALLNVAAVTPLYGDPNTGPIPLFVIDPLGIHYPNNASTDVDQFPHRASGPNSMPIPPPGALTGPPPVRRLTLRRAPGNAPTQPLLYAMTDRLFRGDDDFDFTEAVDGELRPHPTLVTASAAAQRVPTSGREYKGDYSWLVTIAPAMSEIVDRVHAPYVSPPPPTAPRLTLGNFATTQRFTASLVVLYKRNLVLDRTVIANPPPERMVVADFLPGTGLGGGSVRLRTTAMGQNPLWLGVRPNQWIMLSTWVADPTLNSSPGAGDGFQAVVQWYRIRSVGGNPRQDQGNMNVSYRDIILDGPDFPVDDLSPPVPAIPPAWPIDADNFTYMTSVNDPYNNFDPRTVYATIIEGAIAVHERTISLEGASSIWNH